MEVFPSPKAQKYCVAEDEVLAKLIVAFCSVVTVGVAVKSAMGSCADVIVTYCVSTAIQASEEITTMYVAGIVVASTIIDAVVSPVLQE